MYYVLSEILPVFGRCFVHDAFKIVVEIGKIVITTIIAYLGDGLFSLDKHLGCNTYPYPFHILREGTVGFFLEIPAE